MRTSNTSSLAVKLVVGTQRKAFTLIELLVVIAIIALLIAILLPVFARVQESTRQSSTMSHLQAIQNGLALYKLDNGDYPQVLFSYAYPNVPMSNSAEIAADNQANGVSSLFPTYVKDYHDFLCADNPTTNLSEEIAVPMLTLSSASGACPNYTTAQGCYPLTQLVIGPQGSQFAPSLYAADAFDSSPRIASDTVANQFANGNQEANFQYVARYQQSWTAIQALQYPNPNTTPPNNGPLPTCYSQAGAEQTPPVLCTNVPVSYSTDYLHQLRWQSPPADGYVTSTTYHVVPGDKILVLFESGSVIKIQPNQGATLDPLYPSSGHPTQYIDGYDDSTSCYGTVSGASPCTTDANGDNPGKFWKISNGQ